jgi:hypothetical protein
MIMPSSPGSLRPDLVSVEMSGLRASIFLTQGAINLWFGRNVEEPLVSRILRTISKVDCSAEHEKEVLCNFEEISEFENNGFILSSYARKQDKYRAIFVVPFCDSRALGRFIQALAEELKLGEVKIALRWMGGLARMKLICEEMTRLNYFTSFLPTYREQE